MDPVSRGDDAKGRLRSEEAPDAFRRGFSGDGGTADLLYFV